jgi:hypothetical protein
VADLIFVSESQTTGNGNSDHAPFFQKADAPRSGNPLLHGGEAVVTWLATGETRVYNRLELTYGYGSPDRFGLVGATQFFQTRLQLQL